VEKFSKISSALIARYELSNSHKSPFGPCRTCQLHFTSSHLYEKISKMVVLFHFHSSRQVGYMLENFQIIWNCKTYGKNIVSNKKSIMIQNTKLLRFYLWN